MYSLSGVFIRGDMMCLYASGATTSEMKGNWYLT